MNQPYHLLVGLCLLLAIPPIATAQTMDLTSGLENSVLLQLKETNTVSNRLRLTTDLDFTTQTQLQGRVVIDNRSHWQESGPLTSSFSIHRAILEYEQGRHLLLIGRQRIPLGVGRIWNPIDRFNPIDIHSPEPEEREGSEALRHEYSLTRLGALDLVIARRQQLARVKTFKHEMDLGLIAMIDNRNKEDTLGWEMAGALGNTKIEIRSEGGLSRERDSGEWQKDWIIGGEYPLSENLALLGEYHHDSQDRDALGWLLSLQPEAFWSAALLGIVSLNDGSFFLAPSLHWSLADEQTLDFSIHLYSGNENKMFGGQNNQGYLRWSIHF
ncbi:MAG: hypothetical protein H8E79_04885 [Desulfobulbaceae bacterium]|uniref:DUF481 domain-containing protein n=1 Tax=Candidatus Desulfatifera sulfidica TaxID=2841691 RepID=A0A8J6N816_9BACT|nr:hypothetical protein [Candidatus Desulfatifera sulfidica]